MGYRSPAEMPTTPRTPIQRLVVSRYGIYPAIGIVLGALALAAVVVTMVHARSTIACTRAAPGAVPRCSVEQVGLTTRDVAPFDLHAHDLRVDQREQDDSMEPVIVTPKGDVTAAVTREFAQSVVSGADAFATSPDELSWSMSRANDRTTYAVGFGMLLFVAMIGAIVKQKHIELDPDAGVVRVGSREHPLDRITTATVDEIEDSAFHSLVLRGPEDTHVTLAQGQETQARAAANAINAALATRRESGKSARSPSA